MVLKNFFRFVALSALFPVFASAAECPPTVDGAWTEFNVTVVGLAPDGGDLVIRYGPTVISNPSFAWNNATASTDTIRTAEIASARYALLALRSDLTCDQLYRLLQAASRNGVNYAPAGALGQATYWHLFGAYNADGTWNLPVVNQISQSPKLNALFQHTTQKRKFVTPGLPGPHTTDRVCFAFTCDADAFDAGQVATMAAIVLE